MRLLLDEHLAPTLAEQLRARGHDVVAVVEELALRGSSDAALLDWATAHDRAVATYNVRHFMPLFAARASIGEPVAGLILISGKSYPRGDHGLGALLRDLARVLDENPSRRALSGRAVWLGG